MKSYEERTKLIAQKAEEKRLARNRRRKALSVTALCMGLVLALNLVLFLPIDNSRDLTAYRGSEYYPLIQKLDALTRPKNSYKNNFEKWFSWLGNAKFGAAPPVVDEGKDYQEVTNNQVAGVVEGDLFKRTDEYIYYLHDDGNEAYQLQLYPLNGENTERAASFSIAAEKGFTFAGYRDRAEIYLSADGETVTLFTPAYHKGSKTLYTSMIAVDVSDPSAIRVTGRFYVSGNYISSRAAGGDYLLITDFNVRSNVDFSKEEEYLPQTGAWKDLDSIPLSKIVYDEDAASARYTVVTRIGAEDFQTKGSYAFLAYAKEPYVSRENVFLTSEKSAIFDLNGISYSERRTTISCISYAEEELKFVDDVEIAGTVLNRYCLDEHDGILRAAVTVERFSYGYTANRGNAVTDVLETPNGPQTGLSASLYCVDLSTFTVIGALEWFAPLGEQVRSARFDEKTAYVCTAIQLTDPVFAIDLSDPKDITYKDTGTIPGYSVTLMPFADGTLLGIGYGDLSNTLKIELYRETENSVESAAEYTLRNVSFSEQFKAHFIDRENNLIGLGVYEHASKDPSYYVLLRYDGYDLIEALKVPLYGNYDRMRAAYANGCIYLLSGEDFHAETL